jgi:hypothetical protein
LKDFFVFFKTASQDILEQVGQEAALKRTKKDSKSEDKEYLIPFIRNKLQKSARILPRTEAWSERASLNKLPSSEGEGSQAKGALNFEAYF